MTGGTPAASATAEPNSLGANAGQSPKQKAPPFKAPPPVPLVVNGSLGVAVVPTPTPKAVETPPTESTPSLQQLLHAKPLPREEAAPIPHGTSSNQTDKIVTTSTQKEQEQSEAAKDPSQPVAGTKTKVQEESMESDPEGKHKGEEEEKRRKQEHLRYWQDQLRQLQEAHAAEVATTNQGSSQQASSREAQATDATPANKQPEQEIVTEPVTSATPQTPEGASRTLQWMQHPQFDEYMQQQVQVHHLQNYHHLQQLAQQEQSPEIQAHIQAYLHAYTRLWQEQLGTPTVPQAVDPVHLLNVFDDFLLRSIAPSEPMSSLLSTANVLYAFDKHIDGDSGRRSRERRKSRSPYSRRRESRRRGSPRGSSRRGRRRSRSDSRHPDHRRRYSEYGMHRRRDEDDHERWARDDEENNTRRDDEHRERRSSSLKNRDESRRRKDRDTPRPMCVHGSVAKCIGGQPGLTEISQTEAGAHDEELEQERDATSKKKESASAREMRWKESRLQSMEQGAMMREDKETEQLLFRPSRHRRHRNHVSSSRLTRGRRRDRFSTDEAVQSRRASRLSRQHQQRNDVKPRGSVANAMPSAAGSALPDAIDAFIAESEANASNASYGLHVQSSSELPDARTNFENRGVVVDAAVEPAEDGEVGLPDVESGQQQPVTGNQIDDMVEQSSEHFVQDDAERTAQAMESLRLQQLAGRQMASCKPGSAAAKAAAAALKAAREPRVSTEPTPLEQNCLDQDTLVPNSEQDAGDDTTRRKPAPPQLPPPPYLLGLRPTPKPPPGPPPPFALARNAKPSVAPGVSGYASDFGMHSDDYDEYSSASSFDRRSYGGDSGNWSGSGSDDDYGRYRNGVWRRPVDDNPRSAMHNPYVRPWTNRTSGIRPGALRRPAGQWQSRAPIGAPGRREHSPINTRRYTVRGEEADRKSEKLGEEGTKLPPWRVGNQRYNLWSGRRIQVRPTKSNNTDASKRHSEGGSDQGVGKGKDDSGQIEQEDEFEVCVHRSEGSRLGIHLRGEASSSGCTLLVESLSEDENGLIPSWNSSYPKSLVRVGDRIVSVNGVRGRAKDLLSESSKSGELKLLFARKRQGSDPSAGAEKCKQDDSEAVPLPHVGPLVHGAWPGPIARPFEEEKTASSSLPNMQGAAAYRKRVASLGVDPLANGDPLTGLGATLGRRPRVPGAPGWAAEAERNFQRAHAKWRKLGGVPVTSETSMEQVTEPLDGGDGGDECQQDTEEVKRIPKSWQQHLAMVSGTSAGGGARLTRPSMVEEMAAEEQTDGAISRALAEEPAAKVQTTEENYESGGTLGFDQWPAENRPRSAFRKPEEWNSLVIPSMVKMPEPLIAEATAMLDRESQEQKPATAEAPTTQKAVDGAAEAGLSDNKEKDKRLPLPVGKGEFGGTPPVMVPPSIPPPIEGGSIEETRQEPLPPVGEGGFGSTPPVMVPPSIPPPTEGGSVEETRKEPPPPVGEGGFGGTPPIMVPPGIPPIEGGSVGETPKETHDITVSECADSSASKELPPNQNISAERETCAVSATAAEKEDEPQKKNDAMKNGEAAKAAAQPNEKYPRPDGRVRLRIFDKGEEIEGFKMDQTCIILGATLRSAHIADGTHKTVKTQHAAIVFRPPDGFAVQALNGDVKLTGAAAHKNIVLAMRQEGRTAPRETPSVKNLRVGSRPEPLTRQRCVFQLGESQMLFLLDILPTRENVRALGVSRHLLHAFVDGRAFLFGEKRRRLTEDAKDMSQAIEANASDPPESQLGEPRTDRSDIVPNSGTRSSIPSGGDRLGVARNCFERPSTQIFPRAQIQSRGHEPRSPTPTRGNWWTHDRPLWTRRSPQRGRSPSVWRHDKVQSIPRSPGQTRQREASSSDRSLPARPSSPYKVPKRSRSKRRNKKQSRYRSRGGLHKSRSRSPGQFHGSRGRRRGASASSSEKNKKNKKKSCARSPSPVKSARLKSVEARKASRKRKRRRKQAKLKSDEDPERAADSLPDKPMEDGAKEDASDGTLLDDGNERICSERREESDAVCNAHEDDVDEELLAAENVEEQEAKGRKQDKLESDNEGIAQEKAPNVVKPKSDNEDMAPITRSRSKESAKGKRKRKRRKKLGYGYGSVHEDEPHKEKKRKKVKKNRKSHKERRKEESEENSEHIAGDQGSAEENGAITEKENDPMQEEEDVTEMEEESPDVATAVDRREAKSEVEVEAEESAETDEDRGDDASGSSGLQMDTNAHDAESEAAHSIASSHSRQSSEERPKDYAPWVAGDSRTATLVKAPDDAEKKATPVELNNLMQTVASAFHDCIGKPLQNKQGESVSRKTDATTGGSKKTSAPMDLRIRHGKDGPVVVLDD